MGNHHGGDYGGCTIRTDKPYYFAGETVTGNIYMSIQQDGFLGSVVFLRVSGKEVCRWEEITTDITTDSDGNTTSITNTQIYKGRNTFYCHKLAIHQFNTPTLPRGQYTFPFQFRLDTHLPGSYFQEGTVDGGSYKALISYKVKAEVDSYKNNFNSIKNVHEIIVREPLKSCVQTMAGEMQVNVITWCCIDQGTSYIKCVFDKNNYLPGDIAYLQIEIDNSKCNLEVNQISARLKYYLTLRSKCGREKIITREIAHEYIPGISPRETAIGDQRKEMQLRLADQQIQEPIKPTTSGQLVRSLYNLKVTAQLLGCTCCSQDPHVQVPITIVAPVPITYNQPIQQPSNWNPQVFQPQLVSFHDKDLYVKGGQQVQPPNYNYPSQNQGMNQMAQPYM